MNNQNKKSGFIKKPQKNRCIYIVNSKTSTIPSEVIRLCTREPYAHTSLALDLELNEMYSFARIKVHNPFIAGFISEHINTGVFGRDIDTTCRIGRLWITAEQYERIKEKIAEFKKEQDRYGYNYIGVAGALINYPIERKYNYFCSQFVYSVLHDAGVPVFDKQPGLVRPSDFRLWDELEIVYEGKLHLYHEYLAEKSHYPAFANA